MLKRSALVIGVMSLLLMLVGFASADSYDLQGRTVYIGGPSKDFEEGGVFHERFLEAQREFNCKIEFLPISNTDLYITRLMAGDAEYDIWGYGNRQFWENVGRDMFFPVNTILDESYWDSLPQIGRSVALNNFSYRGNVYSFGVWPDLYSMSYAIYNKTMLDREGVEDPYELYLADEWTWDKMTQIAKAVTRDTDGDGEIDQWGIEDVWWRQAYFYALANNAPFVKRIDDRYVFVFDETPAIETLEQIHRWFHVDRVIDLVRDQNHIHNGKAAMYVHNTVVLREILETGIQDEFRLAPVPKGPNADRYVYPIRGVNGWVLPATSKEPEAMIALVHFLWPPEEYMDNLPRLAASVVSDRQSMEVILRAHQDYDGEAFDLERVLGDPLVGPAMWSAIQGEKSARAAMEEVKDAAQSILDELFDQ